MRLVSIKLKCRGRPLQCDILCQETIPAKDRGGQKVYVDPSQALAKEAVGFDKGKDFLMIGNWGRRKSCEQIKDDLPVRQISTCQLTYNQGMASHMILL